MDTAVQILLAIGIPLVLFTLFAVHCNSCKQEMKLDIANLRKQVETVCRYDEKIIRNMEQMRTSLRYISERIEEKDLEGASEELLRLNDAVAQLDGLMVAQ